jgi:Distinct helicase family with a unique C-terminal domain including a metal-binding cysteine cluster
MNNPVKIWKELKSIYLKYIDSGFPLIEDQLVTERRQILDAPAAICQPPIIEFVPKYRETCTLMDLCKKIGISQDFASFAQAGLFQDLQGNPRSLYQHQEDAIFYAVRERKHIVVTTGTGSGKTECFLLPIVNDLVVESRQWGNERPRAVRTLILYPLNALAEDQMVRLRRALNSRRPQQNGARDWLDKYRGGHRFYFGRYTGLTPGKGKKGSSTEFRKEKDYLEKAWRSAKEKFKGEKIEMLDHVACLDEDSAEMWERWSMQETPPDILITNYSMLNIMLTRKREAGIFAQTKDWLSKNSDHIFHLVIDELHTYRGTAGTEVAYLLRNLLDAIGLTPDSPQLQILASSASLPDTERSQQYLTDFFGFSSSNSIGRIKILYNPVDPILPIPTTMLPVDDLCQIADAQASDSLTVQIEELLSRYACDTTEKLIEKLEVIGRLRYLLSHQASKMAIQFPQLASLVFPGIEQADKALEGLLLLLNLSKDSSRMPVLPMRAHYFFKNLDGLWACSNPNCDQVPTSFRWQGRKIGKLFKAPRGICNCGSKIFEVSLCKSCGDIFFGGYVLENQGELMLVSDSDMVADQAKYCTIWPRQLVDEEMTDNTQWRNNTFDPISGIISKRRGPTAIFWSESGVNNIHPSDCPNCGAEGKNIDKEMVSPIGKHVTGVQKVNQVMADALMRIMKAHKAKAKLVLFSDSRQAAAKLSAGIELDHYRDVLRQTIMTSLEGEDELKALLNKLRNQNETISDEERDRIKSINNSDFYYKIVANISLEKMGYLNESGTAELDKFFKTSEIKIENIENEVWRKLASLGINPAGPYPTFTSRENVSWKELFRWEDGLVHLVDTSGRSSRLFEAIINKCRTEQLITIFAHKKKSFEALKLGYITLNLESGDEQFDQFADVCIRLLGENWRIEGYESKFERLSFPRQILRYAKSVYNDKNWPGKRPNLDKLKTLLRDKGIIASNEVVLTGKHLYFKKTMPGDQYWECKKCKTIHLHRSCGRCSNCRELLPNPKIITVADLSDPNDYYMFLATTADSFRLHCEELTGQTPREQSIQRQRHFQEIFTGDENPIVDEIDLLSVTTTMEAGVDIGSISAVMMGNVPPQRFNYQQRVGRAGRRGQSLSVALTIAKMNSHDQTHYFQTERMVSAIPSSPYIETRSSEIAERMIVKQVLYQAFNSAELPEESNDNVHGQFGSGAKWNLNRQNVAHWINNNEEEIKRIIQYTVRDGLNKSKEEIARFITEDLITRIDEVVAKSKEFPQPELSEKLANAGYLPMFGFPTKVRFLYQEAPESLPPEHAVSRELDLAISAFAPGSEIVKDKQIFTCVGFVHYVKKGGGKPEERYGVNQLDMEVKCCRNCGFTTSQEHTHKDCPVCHEMLDVITACSPLGFCVDYDADKKDFNGKFEWKSTKMDINLDTRSVLNPQKTVENLAISTNTVPRKGLVHYINTNNGKYFSVGKLGQTDRYCVLEAFDPARRNQVSIKSPKNYALIASKTTGILALSLDIINPNLNMSPLQSQNRGETIKAAFRSWGYLLRKAICSYLEIDTNEIDIGFHVNFDKKGEVFIVEKLENGAGYCNYLSGITSLDIPFESLIKPLLPNGDIYELLTESKHSDECTHSCYDCLRDYHNQHYHSKLDWRLGLDIAGIAADRDFEVSFTNSYWQAYFNDAISQIAIRMKSEKRIVEPNIAIIFNDSIKYLITHPFWSDSYVNSIINRLDSALIPITIHDAIRKSKL